MSKQYWFYCNVTSCGIALETYREGQRRSRPHVINHCPVFRLYCTLLRIGSKPSSGHTILYTRCSLSHYLHYRGANGKEMRQLFTRAHNNRSMRRMTEQKTNKTRKYECRSSFSRDLCVANSSMPLSLRCGSIS